MDPKKKDCGPTDWDASATAYSPPTATLPLSLTPTANWSLTPTPVPPLSATPTPTPAAPVPPTPALVPVAAAAAVATLTVAELLARLAPFLKTRRYHPGTPAEQAQGSARKYTYNRSHIDIHELKRLAGFGDVVSTRLWELMLEIRMRRLLVAEGARKPKLVTGLTFEPETLDGSHVVARTMVDPEFLQWTGGQEGRASLEEILAELVAREPHRFLALPPPSSFSPVDEDTEAATERRIRAWVQDAAVFKLVPSRRAEGRDPVTGAVCLWVPVVRPGSVKTYAERPSLQDVAGNPWLRVLEARCARDEALNPAKYVQIRASPAYRARAALLDDPRALVQSLTHQAREARPYEGYQRRDTTDPRVQAQAQAQRERGQQHLTTEIMAKWCGFNHHSGHRTRQMMEPLEALWSRCRVPDAWSLPRVLATDFYDVSARRYLLHRVYHLPFVMTLSVTEGPVVIHGRLPLHPSYCDAMFVLPAYQVPGSFRDQLANWVSRMSVAEWRYVVPEWMADPNWTEDDRAAFRDRLVDGAAVVGSLKVVYGPWPLEVDPHPFNIWSDILWQRLRASQHRIRGKMDTNPDMMMGAPRQRRNRALSATALLPAAKTRRATVGVPSTTARRSRRGGLGASTVISTVPPTQTPQPSQARRRPVEHGDWDAATADSHEGVPNDYSEVNEEDVHEAAEEVEMMEIERIEEANHDDERPRTPVTPVYPEWEFPADAAGVYDTIEQVRRLCLGPFPAEDLDFFPPPPALLTLAPPPLVPPATTPTSEPTPVPVTTSSMFEPSDLWEVERLSSSSEDSSSELSFDVARTWSECWFESSSDSDADRPTPRLLPTTEASPSPPPTQSQSTPSTGSGTVLATPVPHPTLKYVFFLFFLGRSAHRVHGLNLPLPKKI